MGAILDKLSNDSIFDIELDKDDTELWLVEGCDSWYSSCLIKDEVLALAYELINIAGNMNVKPECDHKWAKDSDPLSDPFCVICGIKK